MPLELTAMINAENPKGKIDVEWTTPTYLPGITEVKYNVEYCVVNEACTNSMTVNITSVTIANLTDGTDYRIRVSAFSATDEVGPAAEVNVTTAGK